MDSDNIQIFLPAQSAGRLLAQIKSFPPAGVEKSFQLRHNSLQDNRFLIGIDKHNLSTDNLNQIFHRINMPPSCRHDFFDLLPQANLVLFGFEQNEHHCRYKVYLEFWEQLTQSLRIAPHKNPTLLHLGFKWDVATQTYTQTRYLCYPLLTIPEILQRLQQLFISSPTNSIYPILKTIITRAAATIKRDSFVYLEAQEPDSPRLSFDINLYKARLSINDILPSLLSLRDLFSISPQIFSTQIDPLLKHPLGHISGGLNRQNHPFVTIYYETDLADLS